MTEQVQAQEEFKIPMTPFVHLNVDGTFGLTEEGIKLTQKIADAVMDTAAGVTVDGEDVKYLDINVALDIINQDVAKIVKADFEAMQAAHDADQAGEGEEA